ncbi:ABC transporter permease [Devosia sp. 2618]|uniref:ABC transporter permease n=1 Tax=Devosia sp. 2618 TaxID=3156454 RepID=UPI003392EC7A
MTTAPTIARRWELFPVAPSTIICVFILVVFAVAAVASPWISPHDPSLVTRNILQPPSSEHWFGTDNLGRDVFSGVLRGASNSMVIGASVGLIAFLIGVTIGSFSGFVGGRVDAVFMQVAAFFQVMPSFILALVAVAILGRSTVLVIAVLSITQWSDLARIVRAQYLTIRSSTYVEAAHAAGLSKLHIAVREILPNAISPVIVAATLNVGSAILLESGLSFLGLGDANNPSWGEMLNRAQPYLSRAWWMSVFPGAAIFLVVVSINFIGDALNHALDPQNRAR